MKKLFYLFLIAALASTLLVCKKKEPAAAMEPEGPEYKIGIVFDVGGRGDKSFNDSAYEGLVLIAKEFEGYIKDDPSGVDYGKKVEMKYLEPKPGGQDREILTRVLAEEGYDLIIGVGFMFSDVLASVAKDFPDIHFGGIDSFVPDLTADSNIICLAFDEHTGSFLIGAVAAHLADGGKIGFLGGMDTGLIHKFQGGFMAGAMYEDPRYRENGMILSQYVGKDAATAFSDPKAGEAVSKNMYSQGAEVIYHAAGGSGSGLFKAAADLDKIALGVDSDQGLIYATSTEAAEQEIAKHIATSMLKRVDLAVHLTAKSFIEGGGKTKGGYQSFGIPQSAIDVAVNEYNKDVLKDILPAIEVYKKKINSKEITVPDHDSKVAAWAAQTF